MNQKQDNNIIKHKKNLTKRKQNSNIFRLFINTRNFPYTNIIKYMIDNFSSYLTLKKQLDLENKYVLYLDDCFKFNHEIPSGQKMIDIETTAIGKTNNVPLDKLISYAFYMMTSYMFIDTNKKLNSKMKVIQLLKYQMGKDIQRDDRIINDKEYNRTYFQTFKDYYSIADNLYRIIIQLYSTIYKDVNYDSVNKILLLSCQNIFNLLTDLIVLKVNTIVQPETSAVFDPKKTITITITKEQQTMEFNFESKLIISRNRDMDPEYPCGDLVFKFLVDLKNNTYSLSEFKLKYDINKCGPEINNIEQNNDNKLGDVPEKESNFSDKIKYIIPAAVSVAGIVAMPFLLGGNKTIKKKNLKTKKIMDVTRGKRGSKWSLKYKRSIDCKRPKGFSQKQHCKYKS